jgi:hypothetical protein
MTKFYGFYDESGTLNHGSQITYCLSSRVGV